MRKQKTKRNLIGLSWLKVMGSTLFAPDVTFTLSDVGHNTALFH